MNKLPFMSHDPHDAGPQYLEDLACGYWFSEALFTAVESKLFNLMEPQGMTLDEAAGALGFAAGGLGRFLQALCAMGLLSFDGTRYYNTKLAGDYLVAGREHYQGDSILWRKYLAQGWQGLKACLQAGGRVEFGALEEDESQRMARIRRYINAMDRVARTKVQEILPLFTGLALKGAVLDVGTGSGAMAAGFLEQFPAMTATLVDLPEVLNYTGELMAERGLGTRVNCCPANILEPWPVEAGAFDLVILSNIVHAYAEEEISAVLARAAACLKSEGVLLIHDFFLEHSPAKAALFDLNMFINTYNGKVFAAGWVRDELARLKLCRTGLIPLASDTALIFAAKDEGILDNLRVAPAAQLAARLREIGFSQVRPMAAADVQVPDWTDQKCQYGCSGYDKRHCPPHSPTAEKTRAVLGDYTQALLLEGEPPTRDFQLRVLQAEKEAFHAGYHKAFAYWAGPCAICKDCAAMGAAAADAADGAGAAGTAGKCRNTRDARPSMEGAGMDVYETVRRAGFKMRPLNDMRDFAKYFALLLLE